MQAAIRWSPEKDARQRYLVVDVEKKSFKLCQANHVDGTSAKGADLGQVVDKLIVERTDLAAFRAFDYNWTHDLLALGHTSGASINIIQPDQVGASASKQKGSAISTKDSAKRSQSDKDRPPHSTIHLNFASSRSCNAIAFNNEYQVACASDAHGQDSCLHLFDLNQPRHGSGQIQPYLSLARSESVTSVKYFTDHRDLVLTGIRGKGLRVYDLRDGSPRTLDISTRCIHNTAIDYLDDRYFAAAGPPLMPTVQIWDRRMVKRKREFEVDRAGSGRPEDHEPLIHFEDVFGRIDRTERATVWSVRFLPSQRGHLGVLGNHGVVKLWRLSKFPTNIMMPEDLDPDLSSSEEETLAPCTASVSQTAQIEHVAPDTAVAGAADQIVSFDWIPASVGGHYPCIAAMRVGKQVNVHRVLAPRPTFSISYDDDVLLARHGASQSPMLSFGADLSRVMHNTKGNVAQRPLTLESLHPELAIVEGASFRSWLDSHSTVKDEVDKERKLIDMRALDAIRRVLGLGPSDKSQTKDAKQANVKAGPSSDSKTRNVPGRFPAVAKAVATTETYRVDELLKESVPKVTPENRQVPTQESEDTANQYLYDDSAACHSLSKRFNMRQRILDGYGFDAEANLKVIKGYRCLEALWSWIKLAGQLAEDNALVKENFDFSFVGVYGFWKGKLDFDVRRRYRGTESTLPDVDHAIECLAKDFEPSHRIFKETQKPGHRRAGLYIMGMDLWPGELRKKVESLSGEGRQCEAAILALLNDDTSLAIKALNTEEDAAKLGLLRLFAESRISRLGMPLSPLEQQYKNLIEATLKEIVTKQDKLPKGDYLALALLQYFTHGSWMKVAKDLEHIGLLYRIAILLKEANDDELDSMLDEEVQKAVTAGNPSALWLTGLSKLGVDLLNSYLRFQGDFQTAILVMGRVCPVYGNSARVDGWKELMRKKYSETKLHMHRVRFLMDHMELAKDWTGKSTLPSVPPDFAIVCGNCAFPVKRDYQKPGSSQPTQPQNATKTRSFKGGVLPHPANNGLACPQCGTRFPDCAICQHPIGSVDPHERSGEQDEALARRFGYDPINQFISYCFSCRHVLHRGHADDWFEKYTLCPVPGCECLCGQRDHQLESAWAPEYNVPGPTGMSIDAPWDSVDDLTNEAAEHGEDPFDDDAEYETTDDEGDGSHDDDDSEYEYKNESERRVGRHPRQQDNWAPSEGGRPYGPGDAAYRG